MNIEIQDIVEALQKGQAAIELLDSILSRYDFYSGQFGKIPPYDCTHDSHSLLTRIRDYVKFDDSE